MQHFKMKTSFSTKEYKIESCDIKGEASFRTNEEPFAYLRISWEESPIYVSTVSEIWVISLNSCIIQNNLSNKI